MFFCFLFCFCFTSSECVGFGLVVPSRSLVTLINVIMTLPNAVLAPTNNGSPADNRHTEQNAKFKRSQRKPLHMHSFHSFKFCYNSHSHNITTNVRRAMESPSGKISEQKCFNLNVRDVSCIHWLQRNERVPGNAEEWIDFSDIFCVRCLCGVAIRKWIRAHTMVRAVQWSPPICRWHMRFTTKWRNRSCDNRRMHANDIEHIGMCAHDRHTPPIRSDQFQVIAIHVFPALIRHSSRSVNWFRPNRKHENCPKSRHFDWPRAISNIWRRF